VLDDSRVTGHAPENTDFSLGSTNAFKILYHSPRNLGRGWMSATREPDSL
jgi:hypothetical protein